jgi:predicted DNA-binding protein
MARISLIRLPDREAAEVDKIADRKGLPFATTVRELICEYINGRASTQAAKHVVDAQDTLIKEVSP